MAAFYTTHATQAAARDTVEALSHHGVSDDDLWLLTGSPLHDIRRQPVGGFADAIGPHARVGTYGNVGRLRRQAAGGFAGDADRWRQGSFADSDRVVITTGRAGAQRSRIARHLEVRRLLHETGLDHDGKRVIDALAMGRTAVVAGGPGVRPDDARPPLEYVARAA
jgi:hypothetical protein